MTDNVVNLPEREDIVKSMIGPKLVGSHLIIDGRLIPNIHLHDRGDTIDFVLDGRFSFEFPREWAYLAGVFAANAMAIGAGYAHHTAETKERPFAPQVFGIETSPPLTER